jgi:hypothetical protein
MLCFEFALRSVTNVYQKLHERLPKILLSQENNLKKLSLQNFPGFLIKPYY